MKFRRNSIVFESDSYMIKESVPYFVAFFVMVSVVLILGRMI